MTWEEFQRKLAEKMRGGKRMTMEEFAQRNPMPQTRVIPKPRIDGMAPPPIPLTEEDRAILLDAAKAVGPEI